MITYSISEINKILKGELIGNTNQKIEGPEELQKANSNLITFIGSNKYAKFWTDSKACAAIVLSAEALLLKITLPYILVLPLELDLEL